MTITDRIYKILHYIKALFKGGFFHILSGNILNKAISMISSIVIARVVDKSDYACLSYADNLYSYISMFSGLGLSSALLKYCVNDDINKKNNAYIKYATTRGGLFEIVAAVLLCVGVFFIELPFSGAKTFVFSMCLYPFFTYLYELVSVYWRTQYENRRYAYGGIMHSILVCIGSVVFGLILGAPGLVVARYLAICAVIALFGYGMVKKCKSYSSGSLTNNEKSDFRRMGISLMIANMFSTMMPINETFLVNNIVQDEVVTANFKVAGLFPQMLLLVAGAVTVYYFPVVSQMTDWDLIRKKVHKIGFLNFFVVLIIAVVGALCTPLAIRILYGSKYEDAIPLTFILWGMRATNCCIRMVPINMLPALGKTKFNAVVAIGSCVVQTILDYYLISLYGVSGAAIGAIIVYAVSGILYWIYFEKVCNDNLKKQKNEV